MITLPKHLEKYLTATGAGLFLAGLVWAWHDRPHAFPVRRQVAGKKPALSEPAAIHPKPAPSDALWKEPAAQAGGPQWIYEVFTPPTLAYDAHTRLFSVVRSALEAGPISADADETPSAVELERVRQVPFRLQLLGYFGQPGDCTGIFATADGSDVVFARPGRRFADLGLTLRTLTLEKVAAGSGVSNPVHEFAVRAIVFDERSASEVKLDSREKALTDTPVAVLRLPGREANFREAVAGDELMLPDGLYRLERIQLDPPEVEMSRFLKGRPGSERLVLRPSLNRAVMVGVTDGEDGAPVELTSRENDGQELAK